MKIFAALGPGDVVAAHRAHIKGESILSETSIIFSGQFFEYCLEQNIETLALSYNRRADSLRDGLLQIENRPRRWEESGGVLYHFTRITYALYLARRARRFDADLAIIDSGTAHYFALACFRVLGVPIAINFHNAFWPIEPKRPVARLIRALDVWFLRRCAEAALGVSPEIGKQVQKLAGPILPFFEYRAQFRSEGFDRPLGTRGRKPFRIIFVGRVEHAKGVLDIAAMAERLRGRSNIATLFEICGDGGALPELRRIIEEKGLDDIVRVHGRLARPELLQAYACAHAVIVPTRGDLGEGLPMACAEAILFGLPIITSRLSNVMAVLGPAIVEAEPENIESYVGAILRLQEDPILYRQLSSACRELARPFLDRAQSYPAAIDRLIAELFPEWKPLGNYEPLFAKIK